MNIHRACGKQRSLHIILQQHGAEANVLGRLKLVASKAGEARNSLNQIHSWSLLTLRA